MRILKDLQREELEVIHTQTHRHTHIYSTFAGMIDVEDVQEGGSSKAGTGGNTHTCHLLLQER